ncbi:AAA family ATPase [uncultured Vagococcus sp.]|uniref:AAA family ATPase n=1 Tax=uncultured Vagococcus sp. TaxID=189676 RepID=UPI0028D6A905|nr:AAA family ATPase [uncultured Vagococcus sp.]
MQLTEENQKIKKMYLENKSLSLATIHRKVTNWYIENKTESPSYYQTRKIIQTIPKRVEDYIPPEVLDVTTLFITAPAVRPQSLKADLESYSSNLRWSKEAYYTQLNNLSEEDGQESIFSVLSNEDAYTGIELIIVDEIDRLKTQTIELLQDIYDKNDLGMIFIEMPGIEKRLSRYPQLYSRVGFSHEYKKLNNTELNHMLEHKWSEMGLTTSYEDYDALTSIIKLSNGNFRLLHRLFTQIERIMGINNLSKVTTDVVNAARDSLVIGNIE